MKKTIILLLLVLVCFEVESQTSSKISNLQKAKQTLNNIYKLYAEVNTPLLHENYTVNKDDKNPYSYLWPLSALVSGVNALARTSDSIRYVTFMKSQIIPALDCYHDSIRKPSAYSSYITEAGESDRFYDDNIWLGIDFVEFYQQTKDKKYLQKAQAIWRFIDSGTDDQLGGGVYWCEQKKQGKNTCSNAPGSVLALKLYEATHDRSYFDKGLALYHWTRANLEDSTDHLYFDNKNLNEAIGRAKYTYNSGQMLQAAALLYKITHDTQYLLQAQTIAKSCINYFMIETTDDQGQSLRLMKKDNLWFTAVMLRGFVELYHQDGNKQYLTLFDRNLDYAWNHARDSQGLFMEDWTGRHQQEHKNLLHQGAMVEMYASLAKEM